MLLVDDESRTYWDHITGEAVHGPRAGQRLATWSLGVTDVRTALDHDPWIQSRALASPGWFGRLFAFVYGRRPVRAREPAPGLPPHAGAARPSPSAHGERPRRRGQGGQARFYPYERLSVAGVSDAWDGRPLHVALDPDDRVPFAEWEDGTRPFQVFTRWYGFAYTYPGCGVFGGAISVAGSPRDTPR